MLFFYGVCFYAGKNKRSNLIQHQRCLEQLRINYPHYTFQMVINVMIDSKNIEDRASITENIRNYLKEETGEDSICLHNFNYGGTIAGLYDTFQFMKRSDAIDAYLMYFEEDFYPTNFKFLEESLRQLPEHIYIGETTYTAPPFYKDIVSRGGNAKCHIHQHERWTDGGYYFSSFMNLLDIESKIGCFHKGDQHIRYDHQIDGIDLGEVGFPTLLYHKNLSFIGLRRDLYFIHTY